MTLNQRLLIAPNEVYILSALAEAKDIWSEYHDVFEHTGPVSANPILTDSVRFRSFCREWAVARTIRKDLQEDFRCTLRDDPKFAEALNDATGQTLDRLHKKSLQPSFGTQDGKRGLISVTSKIATFIRPELFIAWDRFARAGLSLTSGRPKGYWFESYAEYLANVGVARNGSHGKRISVLVEQSGERLHKYLGFQNRVLDLYLMRHGGYIAKPTTKKASRC